MRIINGYVTVEPPLTHQEQRRRMEIDTTEQHPTPASSTPRDASSAQPALVHSTLTLPCMLAWLLSHMLFFSWPEDSIISQTLKTPMCPHQNSGMHLIKDRQRMQRRSWSRTRLPSASSWRERTATVCQNDSRLKMCGISSQPWHKQRADCVGLCSLHTSWKYYGRITNA